MVDCRLLSAAKAFSIGYLLEAVPGILKSLFQPSKFIRQIKTFAKSFSNDVTLFSGNDMVYINLYIFFSENSTNFGAQK